MLTKAEETELWSILGDSYGGPSIGVEDNVFMIYEWGDAPPSSSIIAQGATLRELLADYREKCDG